MATSSVDLFDSTYRHFTEHCLAEIRRETFGEDIGQNSWLTLDEYDRFISWLRLAPGEHVLEVACGSGGPALYLAGQTDCRVIGVDCNTDGIHTADHIAQWSEARPRVEFTAIDASQPLPFSESSFDAIVCIDSMNHFMDRASVLADWFRVLKPGHRAVFTDPVVINGPVTNDELAARSSIGTFLFVPAMANERMIEAAGWRLVQQQDVTQNAARVAQRWLEARSRHQSALIDIEGEARFEGLQKFFAAVHRLSSEQRLSRIAYLMEKPIES